MDDALFVGRIERVCNFHAQFEQQIHRHRLAGDSVFQRLSFEKLHYDEELSVLLPDLVNRADIWVIQSGSGAGLALETFKGVRIPRELFGEKLQGDVAAEAHILSLI